MEDYDMSVPSVSSVDTPMEEFSKNLSDIVHQLSQVLQNDTAPPVADYPDPEYNYTINGANNEVIDDNNGPSPSSTNTSASPSDPIDFVKIGVLSIIILLTIAGNVSVVLSILLRRAKVTRMYFFILHLSIADIFTAFFTLLPEVIWTFTLPKFYGGNVVCKAVKYGQVLGPYLSSYTLVMTAVDRYQAICFPLSNYKRAIHRSHVMLALAWTISVCFSIPQTVVYHGNNVGFCRPEWEKEWLKQAYVVWYALSNFFLPFVVLLFCYCNMCVVLYTNFKKKKAVATKQQKKTKGAANGGGGNIEDNDDDDDNSTTSLRRRRRKRMRRRFLSNASGNIVIACTRGSGSSSGGKKGKMNTAASTTTTAHQQQQGPTNNSSEDMADDEGQDIVDSPSNAISSVDALALPDPETLMLDNKQHQEQHKHQQSQPRRPHQLLHHHQLLSPISPAPLVPSAKDFGNLDTRSEILAASAVEDDDASSLHATRVGSKRQSVNCPRSHSIRTISNATIKTVKLTVVVVVGYLICSAPFVLVQLYSVYAKPGSQKLSPFSWLYWLFTLNSCLNPWIYMVFNPELVHTLRSGGQGSVGASSAAAKRNKKRNLSNAALTSGGVGTPITTFHSNQGHRVTASFILSRHGSSSIKRGSSGNGNNDSNSGSGNGRRRPRGMSDSPDLDQITSFGGGGGGNIEDDDATAGNEVLLDFHRGVR